MSRTIEIIVSPTGQARIETKSFAGPECRQASEFVEQALGKTTGERLTAEFYQAQPAQQQITQENA